MKSPAEIVQRLEDTRRKLEEVDTSRKDLPIWFGGVSCIATLEWVLDLEVKE